MAAILPTDHFLIMAVYALLVSGFFALLWRRRRPGTAGRLFGILLGRSPARRPRRRVADVSVSAVRPRLLVIAERSEGSRSVDTVERFFAPSGLRMTVWEGLRMTGWD